MEKEEEDTSPPFWLQNGQADRRLRRSYSLFLSSGALLTVLLVTSLVFIFIIVPTLRSFTSHIFRPHSVKKSWDSLNLVLVLFAIVCGFLSRNTNEEDRSFSPQEYAKLNPATTTTPRQWYEYSDPNSDQTAYQSLNRLRSFKSYPDLREESLWVAADERWRFYDDTRVSAYRGGLDLDEHRNLRHRQRRPEAEEEHELGIKNIAPPPPLPKPQTPPSPSPPPSSPPPVVRTKAVRRNAKRTYQAIGQAESNDLETENLEPRPSTPSPPSLPMERKGVQSKKKRETSTKEFLTSLRGKKKKKKQRQRSVENFESILNSEPFSLPSSSAPPPPPPLPPPPSVFHNLFSSQKSKHKKRQNEPRNGGATTHEPRLLSKREHSYSLEDSVITGNESHLIPIPPPPPPPPMFKVPAWKFRVQGDFVRVDSISSSRSGSPDLDEVLDSPTSQASQGNSPSAPDGGEPASSLFCPSPDVDTKARTFIERFRAGLRMEKMNSMKEKQGIGRSNLGPSPNSESKDETRPS